MVDINEEEVLFNSSNKSNGKNSSITRKPTNSYNSPVFKNSAPPAKSRSESNFATQKTRPAAPPPVNRTYEQQRLASTSQRTAPKQHVSYNQPTRTSPSSLNSASLNKRTPPVNRTQSAAQRPTPNSNRSFYSYGTPSTPIRDERNYVKPKTTDAKNISTAKKKKKSRDIPTLLFKITSAFLIFLTFIIGCYALVVFGNVPVIVKWRNIWIETAMTTDQHKWLATSFFPMALIDEVMDAQVDVKDIGKTEILLPNGEPDILGQKDLVVGEKDSHGNEVLINDMDEGIVVLKVTTSNFVGRLVMIDDPSRVYIDATDYKNSRGEFICDYLEKNNAIIGMNASGFHDPGGTSVGGIVTAQTITGGEYWGTYSSKYITVGFDTDNRLIVGEFSNWDDYNLRDAFQYHPALIINGDKVIEGSSGWGLQPRSVIGQCENGVVLWLVVDGRQVGYSLGATMGDCADVLEEYGAINAGACDGGSSSVLAYDGEIINKPSTNMPTGRYLPNAWLVKSKSAEGVTE